MRTYLNLLAVFCAAMLAGELSLAAEPAGPSGPTRQWTIYLAQDKHLDYNWCGSTTEIELRMVALLDYYLDLVERTTDVRWNMDCTLWAEVYRRHRGEEGYRRLVGAIRKGRIGYAQLFGAAVGHLEHGNGHPSLLWGDSP